MTDVEKLAEQRTTEDVIAQGVEKLRALPEHFILLYVADGEVGVVTHCNLDAARAMLKHGIEAINHEYAYKTAKVGAG